MTTVMIVDDEESIRFTAAEFIKREGHVVYEANNAHEALALLANEKDIGIIFSDILMPQMTGVQLLEQIHELNPEILVIMMTGEPTVTTAAESLRHGAFDYLLKPVTKTDILQVLGKAIRVKELQDERRRLAAENRNYQDHLETLVSERTEALSASILQLEAMLDGITRALGGTIEARDPYTAGHQKRVATLACAIGRELGATSDEQRCLHMAGLLHDIGKIVVPAEILAKPGKLTHVEFLLIKEHPEASYHILSEIIFSMPVAEIAWQHHERYNGSGYPRGLAGDAILPQAAIIAVADVVEAIASHRPYRPALGLPAAIEEIRSQQGILYDPDVAGAFLSLAGKYNDVFAMEE